MKHGVNVTMNGPTYLLNLCFGEIAEAIGGVDPCPALTCYLDLLSQTDVDISPRPQQSHTRTGCYRQLGIRR
jgi:hypothetical protein